MILGALVLGLDAETAGLRICNALDLGQSRLQVELNGKAWGESGMEVGEVSGLRRLQPGSHRLNFSGEGWENRRVVLNLEAGEIVTLVPHEGRAENGKRMIRVLKLESRETKDRSVTFVYVGEQPRLLMEMKPVGKSWTPISLKRLELKPFTIHRSRGYLPMRVGKTPLHSMPVFEEGHHIVVLYERRNGEVSSLCYRDRGFPSVVNVDTGP